MNETGVDPGFYVRGGAGPGTFSLLLVYKHHVHFIVKLVTNFHKISFDKCCLIGKLFCVKFAFTGAGKL